MQDRSPSTAIQGAIEVQQGASHMILYGIDADFEASRDLIIGQFLDPVEQENDPGPRRERGKRLPILLHEIMRQYGMVLVCVDLRVCLVQFNTLQSFGSSLSPAIDEQVAGNSLKIGPGIAKTCVGRCLSKSHERLVNPVERIT